MPVTNRWRAFCTFYIPAIANQPAGWCGNLISRSKMTFFEEMFIYPGESHASVRIFALVGDAVLIKMADSLWFPTKTKLFNYNNYAVSSQLFFWFWSIMWAKGMQRSWCPGNTWRSVTGEGRMEPRHLTSISANKNSPRLWAHCAQIVDYGIAHCGLSGSITVKNIFIEKVDIWCYLKYSRQLFEIFSTVKFCDNR